ncbi:MAG: hypothetical protein IKU13_03470, partial [Clostridia bacterium]|nr:hypothetical protein [Clostridia bacterium]
MGIVEQYLLQLNIEKRRWRRAAAILTVLSLFVAVGVSWNLRMTGITMANSAGCGWEEHQHTEECLAEAVLVCDYECEEPQEEEVVPADGEETEVITIEYEPEEPQHVHGDDCWQRERICGYNEHIHDMSCYSDPKADVENQLDWSAMFEKYPYTGELYEDLVGIAKTQVGYTESELNYELDGDGVRHGYTRYGAWYGAPYSDWSAMFVSFCLEYAGADTDEYPVSPGADTMAGLWDKQGKYIAVGEYTPQIGDVIFFDDNTAGIVAEVQNSTIYVIGGDVDDAVSGRIIMMNDNSIEGWGVIERTQPEDEAEVTDEIIPEDMQGEVTEEIIDETVIEEEHGISDGPIVTIYAESIEEPQEEIEAVRTYTLKNTRAAPENLVSYVKGRGGTYFITLTDSNSVEVPKENGQYVVQNGAIYSLGITFTSPNGIEPGDYVYQLPSGLRIEGGEGEFILDKTETNPGTVVGTWKISDTGLIEMYFNEKMDKRTQVAITAEFDAVFDTEQDSIPFDGEITVTVQKPPEEEGTTEFYKWAIPGDGSEDYPDTSKLYWTIEIIGHENSKIVGSTLTDRIVVGEHSSVHRYTESDMAAGIQITAGVRRPDGGYSWPSWVVKVGDAGFTWTENEWSYIVPQTVITTGGSKVALGDNECHYWIKYTSTIDQVDTAGTYGYENSASIDNITISSWVNVTTGFKGVVEKTGTFVSDAEGGKFVWEIQLSIPGMKEGKKSDYYWMFGDYMTVHDQQGNRVSYIENDAHLAEATMNYNGQNISVPRIQDATENDIFAWHYAWPAIEEETGVEYGRSIVLLHRCDCNKDTCQFWNGSCEKYSYKENGQYIRTEFCHCWTVDEDVTMTFVYETDAAPLIQEYGGTGNYTHNIVEVYYRPEGESELVYVKGTNASVTIPGVFKKELTQDFNGYTAHYQITVNEAKLVLTDGSPLTIHDVMTDTLAFISGSLVIKAEDAKGNVTTLKQGDDFTVTYDGTGNVTDEQGNKVHVLDIVIKNPQPVMYTLDYDATLVLPENVGDVTGGIKYKNYAVVTLWGKNISADSTEKLYKDINISAKYYGVNLYKTCGQTNLPLPGATFGLYNAQGGLIAEDTTDKNGYILFETTLSKGIILREHELYYMQEIAAPTGYMLDNTKHWFVFCDSKKNKCTTCNRVIGNTGAKRIPFEQIGKIDAVNVLAGFELPATGGRGITLNILCGLILIS